MKNYGLVVAMPEELFSLLKSNEMQIEKLESLPFEVYRFELNSDVCVYVALSNAGQIDAALATQLLITKYSVELVLNYGVVGTLAKELKIGRLFVADKVVKHDLDMSFLGIELGRFGDMESRYFKASEKLLSLCADEDVDFVTCASGDQFIVDKGVKDYLHDTFDASICDMEASAIARTCHKYGVDFFMVKCISDNYEGDGVKEFNTYVKESGNKAFSFLLNILKKL